MDRILVLFDIDGTLLLSHGAGAKAFSRALDVAFGWKDDLRYIRFSGSTDLDVLHRVAERHGASLTPDQVALFFETMPRALEEMIVDAESTLFPGVRALLEALIDEPRILLGLVTGNEEACARIKLRIYDLHGHFTLGAYGHEHADRTEIARRAIRRAKDALPEGQQFRQIFLIGDTPNDVSAAKEVGAVAIAVATGVHSVEELLKTGADHVLVDLSDLAHVRQIMGLD